MTVGKTSTTQNEDGGVITVTAGQTTDSGKDGGSIDVDAGISENADPTNMGGYIRLALEKPREALVDPCLSTLPLALRRPAAAWSSRHLMQGLWASVVRSASAAAPHQLAPVVSCTSAQALQLRAREATSA